MIHVKGADYKTVELSDIQDKIYYGQEKIFSEAQYNSSDQLQRAIRQGKVIVVSRKREEHINHEVPTLYEEVKLPAVEVPKNEATEPPVEELKNAVKVLTEELKSLKESKPTDTNLDITKTLQVLVSKIDSMQQLTPPEETRKMLESIQNTVRGLSVSGPGVKAELISSVKNDQEVFIPSTLRVEDMTNNITLEQKNLGQGNDVNASLQKLKQIQNKI